VQVVPIEKLSSGGFIVGVLSEEARQAGKTRGITLSQPPGSIGLFAAQADPIAESFGRLDEKPDAIVSRLKPQLKLLLARQFLDLVLNGETAQLKVDVTVQSPQGGNLYTLSRTGNRTLGGQAAPQPFKAGENVAKIDVTNREGSPIYMAALAVADSGMLMVLHPANWDSPESASIIEKGQTKTVPLDLLGSGFVEVMVITSASQLRDTLQGLQTIARGRSRGLSSVGGQGPLSFDIQGTRATGESEDAVVESTRNLVNDLTRGVVVKRSGASRGLNPKQSGVFSVVLQVVE
jgi:hypothetical protein